MGKAHGCAAVGLHQEPGGNQLFDAGEPTGFVEVGHCRPQRLGNLVSDDRGRRKSVLRSAR